MRVYHFTVHITSWVVVNVDRLAPRRNEGRLGNVECVGRSTGQCLRILDMYRKILYIETLSVNQWERRKNKIRELYLSGSMQQEFYVMWLYWKYQYAN